MFYREKSERMERGLELFYVCASVWLISTLRDDILPSHKSQSERIRPNREAVVGEKIHSGTEHK